MKKIKYLIPLLLIMFAGCEDQKPDGVIAEDKYVTVFAELIVVDQITDNQLGPISKQQLIDEVYEKHNLTEDEFRISHTYYQQQPEAQVQLVKRVEEFILSERDTIQALLREHQDEELRKRREIADSLDALSQISDTLNQEPDN